MDLLRAKVLAATVATFHEDFGKWGAQDVADCITELVAQVQALTDAGNQLAVNLAEWVEIGLGDFADVTEDRVALKVWRDCQ